MAPEATGRLSIAPAGLALALGAAAVSAAAAGPTVELVQLSRGEAPQQQQGFDRQAIGGLANPGGLGRQLLKTTVSRNHVLVASVSLGTPPQRLRCLLDSGSADLWMPSRRCGRCGSRRSFDAGSSSTFAPALVDTAEGRKPRLVKMTYGTGEILGVAARDTLSLGSWQVANQSFIIVEDAALPSHLSWDGICGLAWGHLAVAGRPLYQHLQEQGHPAVFTLVPGGPGGEGPVLSLGGLPPEAMRPGTLSWASAELLLPAGTGGVGTQRSFWVTSGGVAVGGQPPKAARFLVDTGTNQVLLVPPQHFEAFLRALLPLETLRKRCGVDTAAGGLFICDCTVRSKVLEPLQVHLGGHVFSLAMTDMFRRVTAKDGGEDLCLLEVQPNRMASPGLPASLKDLLAGLFKPEMVGHGCCSWDTIHCGTTTDYCKKSQEHCEQHCNGKWIVMDALPFELPPGSQEVHEVVQVNPGGVVCKTWKVLNADGQVIKQETQCLPPGQGWPVQHTRRLQLMPLLPQPGRDGAAPGAMDSLMDDLWVLGGVFLERFVTVFDFDNGRMGFAEPAEPQPAAPALATTGLDAVGVAGAGAAGRGAAGNAPPLRLAKATGAAPGPGQPRRLAAAVLFSVPLLAVAALGVLRASNAARQLQPQGTNPGQFAE